MPIDFVAVDFPQANRLTAHILAAMISARTKAALEAAKARGVQLCRQLGGSTRGNAAMAARGEQAGGRSAPAHPADDKRAARRCARSLTG